MHFDRFLICGKSHRGSVDIFMLVSGLLLCLSKRELLVLVFSFRNRLGRFFRFRTG